MTALKPLLAAFGLTLLPLTALASGDHDHGAALHTLGADGFTYELFEAAVGHADLDSCPGDFANQVVFCRMTLAEGQMHVFVFSLDGEQPLLAIQSLDPGLPAAGM